MIYIVQNCPHFEHSFLNATTRFKNSCLNSQFTRNSEDLHQFRDTAPSLHLFRNLSTPASHSPPARGSGDAARRGASKDACNKRRTWRLPRITPLDEIHLGGDKKCNRVRKVTQFWRRQDTTRPRSENRDLRPSPVQRGRNWCQQRLSGLSICNDANDNCSRRVLRIWKMLFEESVCKQLLLSRRLYECFLPPKGSDECYPGPLLYQSVNDFSS